MHEGFVNFNAGTLGKAMIEGRISAGVIVGNNSDLGGGSSTMGTLSGGNEEKISIGENCLLGANAGIGISLGNNCIVEAGLYVTSGTKIHIIDSENKSSKIVKAKDISGESNLLFMRDSVSGKVIVKKNQRKPTLNKELHKNNLEEIQSFLCNSSLREMLFLLYLAVTLPLREFPINVRFERPDNSDALDIPSEIFFSLKSSTFVPPVR
jgi:hypothetical protein